MADEQRNTDLETYSPGGLPSEEILPLELFTHESKGGGTRERVAAPGRARGPVHPGDLKALLHGVGTLDAQVDTIPADGEEQGSRVKIVWDQYGRSYLCWKVYKHGRSQPEWYCVKGVRTGDPNLEPGAGGGITPGGAPTERPITIPGGALIVPAGGAERVQQTIGGQEMVVVAFDGSTNEVAYLQVPMPEGYDTSLPMTARFYLYQSGAGAGNCTMGIRAKAVTDSELASVITGSFTETTKTVGAVNTLYRTDFTADVTPESSPNRGDEMWFEIRRNAVADTYAADIWLARVQILYARDRFSDSLVS